MLSCEFQIPTVEQCTIQNEDSSSIVYNNPSDVEILISGEIQDAEKKLQHLGEIIESTKEKLSAFHKKGNLTDSEQILVKEYEQQIKDRLSELHETSLRIQTVLGLSNSDLELLINATEAAEQIEETDDNTNSDVTSEVSTVSEPSINLETLFNDGVREESVICPDFTQPDVSQNEVNQILETISEEEVLHEDAHEWFPVNTEITGALQGEDGKENVIDIFTTEKLVTRKTAYKSYGGVPKILSVDERSHLTEEEENTKIQALKDKKPSLCTADKHSTFHNFKAVRYSSSRNLDKKYEDPVITDEIQEAERKLTYLGKQITFVKDKLKLFQEKGELTDTEQKQVEEYKYEIKNKLAELHKTSERFQSLLGLSNSDLKRLIYSTEEHAVNEEHDTNVNHETIRVKSSASDTSVNLPALFNIDDRGADEIYSSLSSPYYLENEMNKELETILEEEVVNEGCQDWVAVNTVIPELKQQLAEDTKRTNNYYANEELFPKVVICGSEGGDPKIIFCDQTNSTSGFPVIMTQLPYFLHKILSMKEKSLIEIENLQNKRYYLKQELSEKDHAIEVLFCRVNKLETELNLTSKKNIALKEKVNIAHSLEKQFDEVENNLNVVQAEKEEQFCENEQCEQQTTTSCDATVNFVKISTGQHMSFLKEQYNQMQEVYTIREKELQILQGEINEKNGAQHQVQELLASSETELSELEVRLHSLRIQTNEVALYQEKITQSEQNLITSKIMYFKIQDQAEKYRILIKENAQETEQYRRKYLKTQEDTDKLRRQIEVKETESKHIQNQVSMEISLEQNQFQEQLQLLTTIPDVVNKLQLQVQEEQQQWCMAEFRRRELIHELYGAKQQMEQYVSEISKIQTILQESKDDQKELHKLLKDCEKENEDLQKEFSTLKSNAETMLTEYETAEKNTKEKINEIAQLSKKLETYSDGFAHELSRTKNQNEKTRITLQIKISELDDDLMQLRSFAKVMEKDREQVKMDLQSHINWLTEKNEEAKLIIHDLEMQLKNCPNSDNTFLTTYASMAK